MRKFLLPLAFVAATALAACGEEDVAVVEDPAAPAVTEAPATIPPAETEAPVVVEE